jgi:hypothetical protein
MMKAFGTGSTLTRAEFTLVSIPQPSDKLKNPRRFRLQNAFHDQLASAIHDGNRDFCLVNVHFNRVSRTCQTMVELRQKMAELNGKRLVQLMLPIPNERQNN